MISTLEPVVVTSLGWLLPRVFCALGIFGLLFKDCIENVKKYPPCQLFTSKKHTHPAPLHPLVVVGPFPKWGIDFVHCRPTSIGGHGYIIVAMDYFTKWAEAIPTYAKDGNTTALFLFNHIIARFRIPRAIMTNHGSHFQNKMMVELSTKLGIRHDKYMLYYP